jgi:hypothetical protein
MKHVKETLGQYEDYKYFSILESKKEDSDSGEKKFKEEEEQEGLDIVQKLMDNLERFKSAAGGKILKFKEFWEENKRATESFDEEGQLYKMFDSDYVAGTLQLPDEALSDEEIEEEIKEVDDEKGEEGEDEEKEGEEKEEKKEDKDDEKKEKKEEKEEKEEKPEKEEKKNPFKKEKEKVVKESLNEDLGFDEPKEEKPEGLDLGLDEKPEGEEKLDLGLEKPEGEEETPEVGDEGEEIAPEGEESEEGMEFHEDGETHEYFAVFDMSGSEREEIFRTDSATVIDKFKDFFENTFKGAMKEQIVAFKQAQEEKRKEAELRAKEKAHEERKIKVDKFMKE